MIAELNKLINSKQANYLSNINLFFDEIAPLFFTKRGLIYYYSFYLEDFRVSFKGRKVWKKEWDWGGYSWNCINDDLSSFFEAFKERWKTEKKKVAKQKWERRVLNKMVKCITKENK